MEESLGFYLKVPRFCKRNEELRGAAIYLAFLWIKVLVQWEIGNSYGSNERLLKALRVNNEEVLSVENI